jgi:hypothetical protein
MGWKIVPATRRMLRRDKCRVNGDSGAPGKTLRQKGELKRIACKLASGGRFDLTKINLPLSPKNSE